MYKKSIQVFALFVLSFSSTHIISMEQETPWWSPDGLKTRIAQVVNLYNHVTNQKNMDLWVVTCDDMIMCIPEDIVQHCGRLKLAHHFYPHNSESNPLKKIKFTADEINLFISAIKDPSQIDLDQHLNILMAMAEQWGARYLYALCISDYLGATDGGRGIDIHHIVPFLELLKDPLTITIDEDRNHESPVCRVTA